MLKPNEGAAEAPGTAVKPVAPIDTLRHAVIGCRIRGKVHAAEFGRVPGVHLVTTDLFRVGGASELVTYGRLLGIPTHVLREPATLARMIERDKDQRSRAGQYLVQVSTTRDSIRPRHVTQRAVQTPIDPPEISLEVRGGAQTCAAGEKGRQPIEHPLLLANSLEAVSDLPSALETSEHLKNMCSFPVYNKSTAKGLTKVTIFARF